MAFDQWRSYLIPVVKGPRLAVANEVGEMRLLDLRRTTCRSCCRNPLRENYRPRTVAIAKVQWLTIALPKSQNSRRKMSIDHRSQICCSQFLAAGAVCAASWLLTHCCRTSTKRRSSVVIVVWLSTNGNLILCR